MLPCRTGNVSVNNHMARNMAKYKCERCGWVGKPIFMEPATRLCPNCRSINVKKVKKGE